MWTRWLAWAVWAVVAASAVAWGLKFWVRPLPVPAHAVAVDQQRAARGDVLRLLGAGAPPAVAAASGPAPAPASDRIKLIGLVAAARAAAQGSQGLALLALDGKPPRTYKVGAAVDEHWVVQSVSRRSVAIGPAGAAAAVVLEMPALPAAATGTLPRAGDGAAAPALSPAAAPTAPPLPVPPAAFAPPANPADAGTAIAPGLPPAGGGVISAVPAAVGEGEAQANPPLSLSERRARRAARVGAD